MDTTIEESIPKTAFVLFNYGAFGGAEKRFSHLFRYLNKQYPGKFYFFINSHLLSHIKRVLPDFPFTNVRIVDPEKQSAQENTDEEVSIPKLYKDTVPDPMEVDRNASWLRKIYWFGKNKVRQRNLFNKIEGLRNELGIEVFIGVFSGIVPLMFYVKENPRKAAVIFSDMDSWFSDVHSDMKKLWYRKYYSFNNALENADHVDFLSPYILEGVRKRNIIINDDRYSITACSAADYSKCKIGDKTKTEIAFCARLEPDKNPMLYLQAANEILKEFPDVKFHLLGEGSLVDEINSYIDSNNLRGKINFQFHKNPPEIFAGTSIFVSLQTGTNYPSLSVIESMACGNAVIASDAGDTSLLINGSNGVLVSLELDSVISAMKSLVLDKEKAKSLGLNGREFVINNHTIEKEAEYYINIAMKTKQKVLGGNN